MSIPTNCKITVRYTQNLYGGWRENFFPHRVQVLYFFFSYYTINTPSHLFTLHTSAQYKSVYTRFTREWVSTQITTVFLKIMWNIELTVAYISTVHFPSSVRDFLCFFAVLKDEEEVVHSHLPSRLFCQFEISDSSRCLYRVGDKLWLPSTLIGL